MQAVPSANALPQITSPNGTPANAAVVPGGSTVESASGTDGTGGDALSFGQVLAAQIDVSEVWPDLLFAAANSDIEETPIEEQVLIEVQDLNQPQTFPTLNLADLSRADPHVEGAQAFHVQDLFARPVATGGDSAQLFDSAEGLAQSAVLADAQGLARAKIHGLQASDNEGIRAESIDAQPVLHAAHSSPEAQRAAGSSRAADPAFNPRHIPEPVQSPRWSEALGQRVVWMAKENVQVVYLQVEPPNLGPLEVQLRLSNDQANVMFSSSHPAVREAISSSLAKLDELMAASGVSLGSVSVNTQSPSQDPRNPAGQTSAGGIAWRGEEGGGSKVADATRTALGLVDTFA